MYKRQVVSEAKRRFSDPVIVVAGDFNQWDIGPILLDFPDLQEASVGATRGDRSIDRIFINLTCSESDTVPPLETDADPDTGVRRQSDHRIAFTKTALQRSQPKEMVTYKYRYYNPESEALFGSWLGSMDWRELLGADSSNVKAEIYQREVTACLLYTSPSPRD